MNKLEHTRIDGYVGTWYEIDRVHTINSTFLLMEHETYGDETCCVVLEMFEHPDGQTTLVEVTDTFDDLITTLLDCSIITESDIPEDRMWMFQ